MSAQFDEIIKQHDHQETLQEHHLFSQINAWEDDAIAKIKQVATAARDELRKQLHMAYQENDYTEIDLVYWKERLINIQKELETPLHVDIVPDNDLSLIQFFKLKTIKEDVVIQSLLNSSVTQSNDSFENTDITDKKSLESQLYFYDTRKQPMCFFLKLI
jgi:maltooligosyltrehalose synthase